MQSNIARLMQAKSVTIRALSKETGLSIQTLMTARKSSWEAIRPDGTAVRTICSCTLGNLDSIAQGLGVSIHDLFSDQPSKELDEDTDLIDEAHNI